MSEDGNRLRIDKWLWAARFFKTRSLATDAVDGGHVEVNGQRVKPAKDVRVGDEVRIRIGRFEHVVHVRGLAERRGPAPEAQKLYEETGESRARRERLATELRDQRDYNPFFKGRPTKKQRRDIDRFNEPGEQ